VLVGHSETVSTSFHALGQLPLMRSFDLLVSPASITEWITDDYPAQWPPARWTLVRFNDVQPTAAVPGRDTDHEATGESR
jgi:probable phosphoglycerate mutase